MAKKERSGGKEIGQGDQEVMLNFLLEDDFEVQTGIFPPRPFFFG